MTGDRFILIFSLHLFFAHINTCLAFSLIYFCQIFHRLEKTAFLSLLLQREREREKKKLYNHKDNISKICKSNIKLRLNANHDHTNICSHLIPMHYKLKSILICSYSFGLCFFIIFEIKKLKLKIK